MAENKIYDTLPTDEAVNDDAVYQDDTHIPDENEIQAEIDTGTVDSTARRLAIWLLQKKYFKDYRKATSLFVQWVSVKFNQALVLVNNNAARQSELEKRQTELDERFKNVIGSTTVNSELIDCRSSERFGKFTVVDDRFEYLEQLIGKFVPVGFNIVITHNLNIQPKVVVRTWEYGLGVVPIGSEPVGLFGGTASQTVPSQELHEGTSKVTVSLPLEYKTTAAVVKKDNYHYMIIDGLRTIWIELSK